MKCLRRTVPSDDVEQLDAVIDMIVTESDSGNLRSTRRVQLGLPTNCFEVRQIVMGCVTSAHGCDVKRDAKPQCARLTNLMGGAHARPVR